jgi:radical SAM superfamily enzyme YgiQ (UPF0313 family)
MSTKILLISSSFEEESLITASLKKRQGVKTDDESHYPLGIAYLHAYLETQGHEVKTLFLNNHEAEPSFVEAIEVVKDFSPDIIGFQILTANRISSYKLIEYFHEQYPNIKLLAGGIHASIMYEQLLKLFPYLIISLGEGELTFAELSHRLFEINLDLGTIKGIVYSIDGQIKKTPPRELISDLDILPFPKHEIFFHKDRNTGNLLTTRGCPFNCSFCCLDSISRRKVRYRSVVNIVNEVEWLVKTYPQMTRIWIHDDTFFLNNQRVIDFCDEIVKRGIKTSFICSGRFKPLSQAMVTKLEEANFIQVLFGLESGNEEILKKSHKAITRQDAINAFKIFANSKIDIYAFLIVGLPGETEATILDTAHFIQQLQRIKYVHYSDTLAILTVYPGTEIYEISKTAGLINDDYWLTDGPTPVFTVEHSLEELLKYQETLVNHISRDNFFTSSGFRAQWRMLPYILKDRNIFKDLSFLILQKLGIFILVRRIYRAMILLFRRHSI